MRVCRFEIPEMAISEASAPRPLTDVIGGPFLTRPYHRYNRNTPNGSHDLNDRSDPQDPNFKPMSRDGASC